jgi:hypothetical protein
MATAVAVVASIAIGGVIMLNWIPKNQPTKAGATPAPAPAATSIATPAASQASPNGYAVYLHTKRPQQQIDELTQKLRQAGYELASPDASAGNDAGRVSPRSGVDYGATDPDAKNRDAADKAARIVNESLGTDLKPRAQAAITTSKLGIWLPYRGDYTASLVFAGDFNRDRDIKPFAREVAALGWKWQEPAAGGGTRNAAAAQLCEIRYGSASDRSIAELLAKDVMAVAAAAGATRLAPAGVRVNAEPSVPPGNLQIWIGSGVCK